jgi:hypothetical protein
VRAAGIRVGTELDYPDQLFRCGKYPPKISRIFAIECAMILLLWNRKVGLELVRRDTEQRESNVKRFQAGLPPIAMKRVEGKSEFPTTTNFSRFKSPRSVSFGIVFVFATLFIIA